MNTQLVAVPVEDLTPLQLDFVIATLLRLQPSPVRGYGDDRITQIMATDRSGDGLYHYSPTSDARDCMAIMLQQGIGVMPTDEGDRWVARHVKSGCVVSADHPQVAVCRAYVLSTLQHGRSVLLARGFVENSMETPRWGDDA